MFSSYRFIYILIPHLSLHFALPLGPLYHNLNTTGLVVTLSAHTALPPLCVSLRPPHAPSLLPPSLQPGRPSSICFPTSMQMTRGRTHT